MKQFTLAHELEAIRKLLIIWVALWGTVCLLLMSINIRWGTALFAGKPNIVLPYPILTLQSFSLDIITTLRQFLLGSTVDLLITSPFDLIICQVAVSVTVSFYLLLPVLILLVLTYLKPALTRKEYRLIVMAIVPSAALFYFGTVIAFITVVWPIAWFLYGAPIHGITSYFGIMQFTSIIIITSAVGGLTFLLPIAMAGLSAAGIVPSAIWREKMRIVLFVLFVAACILTPDPTGISAVFFIIPIAFLYGFGYYLSNRFS